MAPTEDSSSSTTKGDESFERFKNAHTKEFTISPFNAAFIVLNKDAVKDISITDFVKYHAGIIGDIGIIDVQYLTPGDIIPSLARMHRVVNKSGCGSGVNINNVTAKFMKQAIILHGAKHIHSEQLEKQIPQVNGLTDESLVKFAEYIHRKPRKDEELKGLMYGMAQYVNTAAKQMNSNFIEDIFQKSFSHIPQEERNEYILYMIGTPEAFLSYVIQFQLSLSHDNGASSCLDIEQDYNLYASPNTFRVHVNNTRLNTQAVKTAYLNPIYCGENKLSLKDGVAAKFLLNRFQESDSDLLKYRESFLKYFVSKKEDCFKLPVEQVLGSISFALINELYPTPFYLEATPQQMGNAIILDRLALLMSTAIHGEINPDLTPKMSKGDDRALVMTSYLINNKISMDHLTTYRADSDEGFQQKTNLINERVAAKELFEKLTTSEDDQSGSVETSIVMSSCVHSLFLLVDNKHLVNTDLIRADRVESISNRSNFTKPSLKHIKEMRVKAETTVLRDKFKFSGVEVIFARMSYCLPLLKIRFILPAVHLLQGIIFNRHWQQQNVELSQQCNLCPGIRISHEKQECCIDYLYHSVLAKLRGATLKWKDGEELEKFFNKEQQVVLPGQQKPFDVKYRHNTTFIVKENTSISGRMGSMRIAHVAPDGFKGREERNKDANTLKSIDDMTDEEQRRERNKDTYPLQRLCNSVQMNVKFFDENYVMKKHKNVKNLDSSRDMMNAIADHKTLQDLGEIAYDTFVVDILKNQYSEHQIFKPIEHKLEILAGVDEAKQSEAMIYDIEDGEDDEKEMLPRTKRLKLQDSIASNCNTKENTSTQGSDAKKVRYKKLGLAALFYYVDNQGLKKITEQQFNKDLISDWVKDAIDDAESEKTIDFVHPLCSAANDVAVSVFKRYFFYLIDYMKNVFTHVCEKLHLEPEELDKEFANIYLANTRAERVYTTVNDFDLDNTTVVKTIKNHTFMYMKHCMECLTELDQSYEPHFTWQHSKMTLDQLFKSRRGAHFENKTVEVPFIGMFVDGQSAGEDGLWNLDTIKAKQSDRQEYITSCLLKTKAPTLFFNKEQYEQNLYKQKSAQSNDEDVLKSWQKNDWENYDLGAKRCDEHHSYKGGNISIHAERDGGRAELFKMLRDKSLSLLKLGEPGFAGDRNSFVDEVMASMISDRKKLPILQTIIKSDLMRLSTTVFNLFKKALNVLECVMSVCGVKYKFNMDMINYVQYVSCCATNLPILKKMCTQNIDLAASLHVLLLGAELYDIIEDRNMGYHIIEFERLSSLRTVSILTALRLSTSGTKPSQTKPIQVGMPITYNKTLYADGKIKVSAQDKVTSRVTYLTANSTIKSYGSPMNTDEFFTQIVMGMPFSFLQQTFLATMASQADYKGSVMLGYSLHKFPHIHNKLSFALIDELIGITVELLMEKIRNKDIQMDKLVNVYMQNIDVEVHDEEKTLQECLSFHQNIKEPYEKDMYRECIFPDIWRFLTATSADTDVEKEDEEPYDMDIWIDM